MKKIKISQKMMAFYKLYQARKEDKERYLPGWEFLGEMFVKELDQWVLMSYKCPTRLTDLFQENPYMLERTMITGKSGAMYYGYRFSEKISVDYIKDAKIKLFYLTIKNVRETNSTKSQGTVEPRSNDASVHAEATP